MPWSPSQAKDKYPKLTMKQAQVWSKVANDCLDRGDDEGTAIRKANAAVNRMKKTEALHDVVFTVTEIGRSISAANAKKIKDHIEAMSSAMAVLTQLLSNDSEEAEAEAVTEAKLDEAAKILAQSDSYDSIRYAVQQAIRKRAISQAITSKLADGTDVGYDDYYYGCMPYIRDLYDGYVVYSINGELYQCEYTVSDNDVTLGEPTHVKVSYVPYEDTTTNTTTEEKEIAIKVKGELVKLVEKAVDKEGRARIKLISPGWGSSGYYGESMLKRDGPNVFKQGMHMYVNHPTQEEDENRPERDLKDLAGVISSEVVWEDKTPTNTGKGLYADVQVFGPYREFIDEAAPYIGTSIRAGGLGYKGEAEGQQGYIIESLNEGYSVDYVTYPGRGGEILSLYESARSKVKPSELELKEVTRMDGKVMVDISPEELEQLRESAKKTNSLEEALTKSDKLLQTMRQSLIASEARNAISETLTSIEMPEVVRQRLKISCSRNIPCNEDGSLNREQLIEKVKEAATEELQYIESVTGSTTNGKVVGMSSPLVNEINAEEVDKALEEEWRYFGLSENGAKIAVNGR